MSGSKMGLNRLAAIQYIGISGSSQDCVLAVEQLIQCRMEIVSATLLTCDNDHAFLLKVYESDLIAVKWGFTSGYSGEGPRALGRVLSLLSGHRVMVEEVLVGRRLLSRLDLSALTVKDIDSIETSRPIRPLRIHDYIYDAYHGNAAVESLWPGFRRILPLAIIDRRIVDLALVFFDRPNEILLTGFRRLEDIVRKRIKSAESGTKLFSQAFLGDFAKLGWKNEDVAESIGRANIFIGAYLAHRNPRAHREIPDDLDSLLSEFLVLNHLFRLEELATLNAPPQPRS